MEDSELVTNHSELIEDIDDEEEVDEELLLETEEVDATFNFDSDSSVDNRPESVIAPIPNLFYQNIDPLKDPPLSPLSRLTFSEDPSIESSLAVGGEWSKTQLDKVTNKNKFVNVKKSSSSSLLEKRKTKTNVNNNKSKNNSSKNKSKSSNIGHGSRIEPAFQSLYSKTSKLGSSSSTSSISSQEPPEIIDPELTLSSNSSSNSTSPISIDDDDNDDNDDNDDYDNKKSKTRIDQNVEKSKDLLSVNLPDSTSLPDGYVEDIVSKLASSHNHNIKDGVTPPWWRKKIVFGLDPPQPVIHPRKPLYFKVNVSSVVVRRALRHAGFRKTDDNTFNALWGRHLKLDEFRRLKPYQKVNHFPRTFELGRKDKMTRNIMKMARSHGKAFDFIPKSYILPEDRREWEQDFIAAPNTVYIYKPRASARGIGIKLVTKYSSPIKRSKKCLISQYLGDPYLINGYKFDLRVYVLVTNWDPLRVYIYDEGLARFATVKYSFNFKSAENKFMHLTNFSINKDSPDFVKNTDADEDDYGSKWSLSALWRYLAAKGADVKSVWSSIKDVCLKTLISVEPSVSSACKMYLPAPGMCFELFGFDILLDSKLKPWLLEVNVSPSLGSPSPLDRRIKWNCVVDTFNIIGFEAVDRKKFETQFEKKKLARLQTNRGRSKSASAVGTVKAARQRGARDTTCIWAKGAPPLHTFLQHLTTDEKSIIDDTFGEFQRKGRFQILFPTLEADKYFPYFESPRHNNLLVYRWLQAESKARNVARSISRTVTPAPHKVSTPTPAPPTEYSTGFLESEGPAMQDLDEVPESPPGSPFAAKKKTTKTTKTTKTSKTNAKGKTSKLKSQSSTSTMKVTGQSAQPTIAKTTTAAAIAAAAAFEEDNNNDDPKDDDQSIEGTNAVIKDDLVTPKPVKHPKRAMKKEVENTKRKPAPKKPFIASRLRSNSMPSLHTPLTLKTAKKEEEEGVSNWGQCSSKACPTWGPAIVSGPTRSNTANLLRASHSPFPNTQSRLQIKQPISQHPLLSSTSKSNSASLTSSKLSSSKTTTKTSAKTTLSRSSSRSMSSSRSEKDVKLSEAAAKLASLSLRTTASSYSLKKKK